MTRLKQLAEQGLDILTEQGPLTFARRGGVFAYESAFRTAHKLTGRTNRGTNIYDQSWDVLVILDACRVDLMSEIAPEYDFVNDVGEFTSVSSYSLGWMEKTFTDEYEGDVTETAYVTANPFSQEALDSADFAVLDEVWTYGWDESVSSVPPRPVTDRGIDVYRKESPNRLILHYMQPHIPFITHPELMFQSHGPDSWGEGHGETIWERVRRGDVAFETMWEAYLDNLRVVLDDIELLLDSIDAEKVVLTADHANAVGECGIYGHPRGIAIDAVRVVPWVETTAKDTGEYEPASYDGIKEDGRLEKKLQHLGYM